MSDPEFRWCHGYRKIHPEFEYIQCCSSCHDEYDEGYGMCGKTEGGIYYELCCKLATAKDFDDALEAREKLG